MPQRGTVFLCFLLALVSSGLFGQSSIAVYPNTVYRGQATTFLVSGTNTTFSTASGCRIFQGSAWNNTVAGIAFPIIPSNTTMYAPLNIPLSTPTGAYTFRAESNWWGWLDVPITITDPPANKGIISGRVTRWSSTNCFSGQSFANQVIKFTPGPYYAYTDAQGNFSAWLPLGNYTVSLNSLPSNHIQICPSSPPSYTIASAGQSFNNVDFYLQQQPGADVSVNMMVNIHRPGFTTTNYVLLRNLGVTAATNVVIKAVLDTIQTYTGSNPNATVTGDTLEWTVPLLPGNSSQLLYFDVVTPINTWGWNIIYSATATTSSTDINPGNNYDEVITGVTGSYDPNDKQVWTQDEVVADGPINPTDSLLKYLVRFQNTGNDTAFNIFIRDTLSPFLDPTTLQVTGFSHDYYYTINNGNQVEFIFPNILLEDSTSNEPASHGQIEFTIKRLPGLPLGTEIDNTAHIYFDFNSPVVTNTVTSKICPPVDLDFSISSNLASIAILNNSTGSLGSILWEFGDGNTSTAFAPGHTYASPGEYNVCLTVTDTCGVRSLCQRITITCQLPVAAYQSTANQLTVNFTNQSSGGFSWAWTFGDGNSSNLQDPSHTYAAPGTYQVCLGTTDSCGTGTICDSVQVVCLAPAAAFSASPAGLQVQFSDLTSDSVTAWSWTFGDGNSSSVAAPQHVYGASGAYTVCLTVTNECGATDSTCQTLLLLGMEEGPFRSLMLYPNPNNGRFRVEAELAGGGHLRARITDLTGRVLYEADWGKVWGDFRRNLETDLPAGSYFLDLELNGRRISRGFNIR